MIESLKGKWRDASLTTKGGLAILLMLLAMMLAAAIGMNEMRANARARLWVAHSIKVRREIHRILQASAIATAQHYAHLLSGSQEDAEQSMQRLREAQDQFGLLATMVGDQPEQMLRLGKASHALEAVMHHLEQQQEAFGGGLSSLPVDRMIIRQTESMTEELLSAIEDIQEAEQLILDGRLAKQRETRNRSFLYFGIAILAGIVGGAGLGIIFTRGVVSRIQAIGDHALADAESDAPQETEDQGHDEIGQLAARLRQANEMARQRDAAARESRARLQAIMDHMTSLVYVKSLEGKYLFVNKAFEVLAEPIYGNIIGKTNADFRSEEEALRIDEIEGEVVRCGIAQEAEETFHLPQGDRTFMTVRFLLPNAEGKPEAVCGIFKDITEKNRAVIALQRAKDELEERVRKRTAELAAVNDALRHENSERARAKAKVEQQLLRTGLLNQITKGIAGRTDLSSLFNVVLLNLKIHLEVDLGIIFFFEESSNILLVGAHAEKEDDLARSLKLEKGQVLAVGDNGLRKCVLGETIYEPLLNEDDPGVIGMLARAHFGSIVAVPIRSFNETLGVLLVGRRKNASFESGDCEFLTQLGEHIALALAQIRLLDQLKRAYEDLKQTQHHMAQQERLRAMGQMASGIAHDINNQLGPITLYCEVLLEDFQLEEGAKKHIRTILNASENIAKTVAGLRHFYRPSDEFLLLDRVKLNPLVQAVVELTKPRWRDMSHGTGKTIDIKLDLASDEPAFDGSESDVRNVLTNLIFNSIDAMPEGGALKIRTSSEAVHAILEVQDSGVGMDETTRARCMDPFFTTKGDHGTGLGLSMVYGSMKRHHGYIEVDSSPGEGTTFRLLFPQQSSQLLAESEEVFSSRPGCALRILCVDDDIDIRTSLETVLVGDGHQVTLADGGAEALALCNAVDECPFDVIITDLGMPHMDGREFATKFRQKYQNIPIILLTGWGSQLREQTEQWTIFTEVLAKPPRLQELRNALAKAMR